MKGKLTVGMAVAILAKAAALAPANTPSVYTRNEGGKPEPNYWFSHLEKFAKVVSSTRTITVLAKISVKE